MINDLLKLKNKMILLPYELKHLFVQYKEEYIENGFDPIMSDNGKIDGFRHKELNLSIGLLPSIKSQVGKCSNCKKKQSSKADPFLICDYHGRMYEETVQMVNKSEFLTMDLHS